MHRYFIKTHRLVKLLFRSYTWNFSRREHAVYLTFDDGPTPGITPWVLEQLRQFNAKATFFCVGEQVAKFPALYQQVMAEGHTVGNHSHTHPNGWHMQVAAYVADVAQAAAIIHSPLFRPPYGRIKKAQAQGVKKLLGARAKIIMWDVLSCDFDPQFSKEHCLQNVITNVEAGSIIVFHDSEKAAPNMQYALPKVLQHLAEKKFAFKAIVS